MLNTETKHEMLIDAVPEKTTQRLPERSPPAYTVSLTPGCHVLPFQPII